jgi:hypothetical protein
MAGLAIFTEACIAVKGSSVRRRVPGATADSPHEFDSGAFWVGLGNG